MDKGDILEKVVVVIALAYFVLSGSGCTSLSTSREGPGHGSLKNAVIHLKRTPMQVSMMAYGANAPKWWVPAGAIVSASSDIAFALSESVRAFKGITSFPFTVIPVIVEKAFTGIASLKEETAEQEVEKTYAVEGMTWIKVRYSDDTKVEAKFDSKKGIRCDEFTDD